MGLFEQMPEAPVDPILGTTQAFNADPDPRKINLGVGAYRCEAGKPYVLKVVKDAEELVVSELGKTVNKEYSTIDGPVDLKALTQNLIFGEDSPAIRDGRVASVQALSGTGSLRVAAEFIRTHMAPEAHEVWVSDPTWGNHNAIFEKAGLAVKAYPYYCKGSRSIDFAGMMRALREDAKEGSVVLLHACAHNPTGVDPSDAQWKEVADVMRSRRLVPLMDSAYQGYASGCLDKDAFATRLFVSQGFEMYVCQSFAKNLGLYGERIGMLHVVCHNAQEAKAVLSQLKLVIRPMYSSPPSHGAELVKKILGEKERREEWRFELAGMAERILKVRHMLRKGLEERGTPGTWHHITDQIGMFSFTGLSPPQCERLIKVHHIYLLTSGRISLAGLNSRNIQYMIESIDEVVRAIPSEAAAAPARSRL